MKKVTIMWYNLLDMQQHIQIFDGKWGSTLYTTLPHNLIKDKLIDLIERTFQRKGSPYLACNNRNAFFTSKKPKKYHAWSCQNVMR